MSREIGWESIDWQDVETCIMQWSPANRQKNAIEAVATTAQIPPIRMYTDGKKTFETVQSACTLGQENIWNSPIRMYTGKKTHETVETV